MLNPRVDLISILFFFYKTRNMDLIFSEEKPVHPSYLDLNVVDLIEDFEDDITEDGFADEDSEEEESQSTEIDSSWIGSDFVDLFVKVITRNAWLDEGDPFIEHVVRDYFLLPGERDLDKVLGSGLPLQQHNYYMSLLFFIVFLVLLGLIFLNWGQVLSLFVFLIFA